MSRVRERSAIEDVDRLAKEEGLQSLEKTEDGGGRTFRAFNRVFTILPAPPGKVGLFQVDSRPEDPEEAGFSALEPHARVQHLFRRAVKWRERTP